MACHPPSTQQREHRCMSGVKRMAVRRVLHTHRPHKACNAGLGTPRKRASVQAAAWETRRYDLLRTRLCRICDASQLPLAGDNALLIVQLHEHNNARHARLPRCPVRAAGAAHEPTYVGVSGVLPPHSLSRCHFCGSSRAEPSLRPSHRMDGATHPALSFWNIVRTPRRPRPCQLAMQYAAWTSSTPACRAGRRTGVVGADSGAACAIRARQAELHSIGTSGETAAYSPLTGWAFFCLPSGLAGLAGPCWAS